MTVGTNYYGLALSFVGDKLNCCVAESKDGKEVTKNKELSWKSEKAAGPEELNRLLSTISEVSRLQVEANQRMRVNYKMPITFAWPGASKVPGLAQYKSAQNHPVLDQVAFGVTQQILSAVNPRLDALVRNIEFNRGENVQNESIADCPIPNLQENYYLAKSGNQQALYFIVSYAQQLARQLCQQNMSSMLSNLNNVGFLKIRGADWFKFFNLPDAKAAMKEILSSTLKKQYGFEDDFNIKLPGDEASDHGFDILDPMMRKAAANAT